MGNVFNIERHSLHDGPGIRTIVFLSGCPLRCKWCANPEGLREKSLFVFKQQCTGCGMCVSACSRSAISIVGGKSITNREKCTLCGTCIMACPEGARRMYGEEMTVEQVINIVVRDAVFYRQSGGGMTLSGGEPFVQKQFAYDLLAAARDSGINTAVETCGAVPWEAIESAVGLVDTFLYDVKHTDPEKHRNFTGKTNEDVLRNIRRLGDENAHIIVRVPLIPEFNDTAEELSAIAEVAADAGAERMDVLPFHKLALSKHDAMETHFLMEAAEVLPSERVDCLVQEAKKIFKNINIEV